MITENKLDQRKEKEDGEESQRAGGKQRGGMSSESGHPSGSAMFCLATLLAVLESYCLKQASRGLLSVPLGFCLLLWPFHSLLRSSLPIFVLPAFCPTSPVFSFTYKKNEEARLRFLPCSL